MIAPHKILLMSWYLRSNVIIVNLKVYITEVLKNHKRKQHKKIVQVDGIDAEDIIKDVTLQRDNSLLIILQGEVSEVLTM